MEPIKLRLRRKLLGSHPKVIKVRKKPDFPFAGKVFLMQFHTNGCIYINQKEFIQG